MPYLSGVLTGILLTILVVFLIDNFGPEPDTRDIVNWDYVSSGLGSSVEKVGEEVRQEVHEATAPNGKEDCEKAGRVWDEVGKTCVEKP
jgi:hypothetical protein